MSTALITGITGQDGYYLSKLLLEKGYEVHGTVRRSSTFNTSRIESLISEYGSQGKLQLHYSDLLDSLKFPGDSLIAWRFLEESLGPRDFLRILEGFL